MVSAYTKIIVYFIMRLIGRLIGRLKPGLHKQSLPSETEEIQPAQAGFALRARYANVCVDAVSTARSSLSSLSVVK
jgi:hypothetical protein